PDPRLLSQPSVTRRGIREVPARAHRAVCLAAASSGRSPDRDPLVGSFADHLRSIERLHPAGRKLERTGVIEAHGILHGPSALGYELIIGAEAVKPALFKGRPDLAFDKIALVG